jgi:DNA-binding NtrC family response regulator
MLVWSSSQYNRTQKHRNRRRDAAMELGISERTLYRKIKEYDLED